MTLRPIVAAPLLRRLTEEFDGAAHVRRDPIQFAHRYQAPADQEVVAFLAASLAFGRVASFLPVVDRLLAALGPEPAAVLADPGPSGQRRRALAAERSYRWLLPPDFRVLLDVVGIEVRERGSLEAAFQAGDAGSAADTWDSLQAWLLHLRAEAERVHAAPAERARAIAFLFPGTDGEAACKRQHLFLRWVVRGRREGVDLGIWSSVTPNRLVVPCDVHVARIAHALGFCSKPDPCRRTADEVTSALRLIDSADPVRFDFALCHLGISGGCRARRIDSVCAGCGLRDACRWWAHP